jgi:hypothetical protein
MSELEYYLSHNAIKLPYREEFKNWNIEIKNVNDEAGTWIVIAGTDKKSQKKVIKTKLYDSK